MSDVPRLSCSIENETVQNAAKNFANILEKAFEQYQKLLDEYLKLLKQCKNANIKISLPLIDSQEHNNEDYITSSEISLQLFKPCIEPESLVLSKEKKTSTSVVEDVLISTPDIDSDIDNTFLSHSRPVQKGTESDELLKSPVLAKRRSRHKKSTATQNHFTLDSSSENNVHAIAKEDAPVTDNNLQQDNVKVSAQMEENKSSFLIEKYNNNDEIECTPISKVPKKLGVSTLYNIDTTLLQSGKKLKQSKLVLLPLEKGTDITFFEKHEDIKVFQTDFSLTPKKDMKEKLDDFCQSKHLEEEVIESSPKHAESQYKKKSRLKLNRKSPRKSVKKSSTKENKKSTESINKQCSTTKLGMPLKPVNESSLTHYSPPMYTSTQKDQQPYLIRKSNTFCNSLPGKNIRSDCDVLICPKSPVLADIEHSCFGGSENLSPQILKFKLGCKDDDSQTRKRKSSQLITCTSTCNDETYFALGEKAQEEDMFNVRDSDFEDSMSVNHVPPPVKRSLMSSFDIVPEKKEGSSHNTCTSSKSKAERAKMTGMACWECKQYYDNLGLSEEEIKKRQNQCSRHRTKYKEKQSTPEGFWNPIFPDTQSSTYQDDSFKA